MRQGFFLKLLVASLVIVVCSVWSMDAVLTWLFRHHFFQQYGDLLRDTLEQVQEVTARWREGEMSRNGWERALGLIDRSSGVHIAVISGRVIVVATDDQLAELTATRWFRPEALESGRTAILRAPHNPSLDLLILPAPLEEFAPGAMAVAYMPVADVNELLREAVRLMWLASGLVLAGEIPFLLLFSRHFTRPLRQLQEAAGEVASGNYGCRLVVHRRDELGALAAAFNKMAAQLEETERNRQELLASISHELRTPLTSIRGFVQGILDGTVPQDRQQAYLSRVYSEAQRLAEIVNDLLDLARLRSGQMRLELEPVDLWALCREVAECLLPAAREKGVEIVLNLPAATAVVEADANRLVQALLNIGDNAVKFTRQGGAVEIAGRIRGERAEIAVRDQGPGIDPELAPRIFEKFFTGGPGGGAGLGLAITKALVDAHAGEIEVESQPGQGSTFRISLPLSQQESG